MQYRVEIEKICSELPRCRRPSKSFTFICKYSFTRECEVRSVEATSIDNI